MTFTTEQLQQWMLAQQRGRDAAVLPGGQQSTLLNPAWHPAALTLPAELDQNPVLEQAVQAVRRVYRVESANVLYDSKTQEYFNFCDYVYPNQPYGKVLTADKVYKFMFYQSFREQKQRGGPRGTVESRNRFDDVAYDRILLQYQSWMSDTGTDPPEPTKPVKLSTIDQYKAIFRQLYKQQLAQRVNSLTWEQIWTVPLVELYQLVKSHHCAVDHSNYAEKLEAEFAPYTAIDKYGRIEQELWTRGASNFRSAGTWLRHRYILLHTTSGILRCESIYRAELSDFMGLTMKKKEDPHPLFLMITQIGQGKFTKVYFNAFRSFNYNY